MSLLQMSEDCLYLNIYAPSDAEQFSNYAVMLFLHGGGFEFSSGGAELYRGERLTSKGEVILVTINYRLGNNYTISHYTISHICFGRFIDRFIATHTHTHT